MSNPEKEPRPLPPNDDKIQGEVALRSPFLTWLENYWYHYKWHTLLTLFALVCLIVCLVQCTKNGKGDDATLLYAGPYVVSAAERQDMGNALTEYLTDYNGDGDKSISLALYTIRSSADIQNQHPSNQAYFAQASYDQLRLFDDAVMAGEATLCFVSNPLFIRVAAQGGFLPVTDYLPDGVYEEKDLVKQDGVAYGVKLSALKIGHLPGFKNLPKDTVFCVRRISTMGSLFNKKDTERLHAANVTVARKLVAVPYTAPAATE